MHVHHDCEIPTKPDDILFLPGGRPFQNLFTVFRKFFMASHKNPNARRYLRSRASIIYERRRHLRNHTRIIHPFSLFRHWWDFLMIFVTAGSLLCFPYQAAFDMRRTSKSWTAVKNLLLTLCWSDITVHFTTGYFDETRGVVELNPKPIGLRYIKHGYFFVDVLGSAPTDLFFVTKWDDLMVTRELTSLNIAFRLFSMNHRLKQMARAYDVSKTMYEFLTIVFRLVLIFHWQTCISFMVPIVVTSMTVPRRPSNDSWINTLDVWQESSGVQYFTSFLRILTVFGNTGLSTFQPKTPEDVYFVIILHLMGVLIFCCLATRAMQLFKEVHSSRLNYEETMAELREFMRNKQLPHITRKRIVNYYEFRFQHLYFRESEILSTISSQMCREIGMHSCRKLVENVTFFNNLPISLLARIVALLRSEIFLANDVIMRANQLGDCMYFIATGSVAIYTRSGKEVCHLEDGAHFGEIALVMPDEKRVASVIAVETCELYRLDRADFERTIHPYPMLWERIKKIAIERQEITATLNAQ